MSLDLTGTAVQIDGMAVEMRARQDHHQRRLHAALEAIWAFPLDEYAEKREQGGGDAAWNAPAVLESPGARHPEPPMPADFSVVAVDGSHIDVDRHLAARCFLINTGYAALAYGSRPEAYLGSAPRLYAREDEMVIRDPDSARQQAIEGAVLGAKRTVEEIRKLVEIVRGLSGEVPTLALLDGSLVMLGLVGSLNQDFVLRELVEEGFARALEELRELAEQRPLAVASYISLPRYSEVVRALRLMACSYADAEAYRCGMTGGGEPCDRCVGGVLDREIFSRLLEPGERSAMFATSSAAVERYYMGNEIDFFYVNTGEEIGRVEVPAWVAEDESSLALAHGLIVDQCRRGHGYPVALMEAHEQAAVTGSDRRYFVDLVERALQGRDLPVYTSEKARSKRMRWL